MLKIDVLEAGMLEKGLVDVYYGVLVVVVVVIVGCWTVDTIGWLILADGNKLVAGCWGLT